MRWVVLWLVAGCYRPDPQAGAPCGPGEACPSGLTCQNGFCGGGIAAPDDAIADADATVIPPDACVTFATQVDSCTLSPGGALSLSGESVYDTTLHELRDTNGDLIPTTSTQITGMAGPVDVLLVGALTVTGTLRVVGDLPFGVLAYGSITITGTIDAGGGGAGHRGFNECMAGVGRSGTTNAAGSSGAGGGAFQGDGGNGGEGDENQVPVAGAQGGDRQTLPLGPLGGCRGGTGGGGTNIGGEPGQGGGAVYLAAQNAIQITGGIDAAGGGGGHGHTASGGGGGGGSGGMIVLEASTVTVGGFLVANGGGGGGGADDTADGDGEDGQKGTRTTARAAGGNGFGTGEGGNGGQGGALAIINGGTATEMADNGGGGGGGGGGYIAIGATTLNLAGGTISPASSTWP